METVGHAPEPDDAAGCYPFDHTGDLTGIGHGGSVRVSHSPECKQRFGITVGAVVKASPAIKVEPRRIEAFAPFVPADGFIEGLKLAH